jgi:hypothetical protein
MVARKAQRDAGRFAGDGTRAAFEEIAAPAGFTLS